jgi:hypothetical protein
MKRRALIVSLVCVCVSVFAAGLGRAQVEQGVVEASLDAAFATAPANSKGSTTFLTVGGKLGYFVTDRIELAFQPSYIGNFDETRIGIFQGQVNYHLLPETLVVPFVGAQGGVGFVDIPGADLDVTGVVGGQLGVKAFVTEHVSVNFQVQYTTPPENTDRGLLGILLGLSYFFR